MSSGAFASCPVTWMDTLLVSFDEMSHGQVVHCAGNLSGKPFVPLIYLFIRRRNGKATEG